MRQPHFNLSLHRNTSSERFSGKAAAGKGKLRSRTAIAAGLPAIQHFS